MTRDTRALDNYQKYLREWQTQADFMKDMRLKKLQQQIGLTQLSRKVYKDQAERDLTLIERYELYQEKSNQQECLHIAINPFELTAG